MKNTLFITLLFFATTITHTAHGCPMSSEEELACSVVLCNPMGLIISESRSECLDVNRRWAWYLATLGFWDSPAVCLERDKNCNVTGRASNAPADPGFCRYLSTGEEQDICAAALGAKDADATTCAEFDADGDNEEDDEDDDLEKHLKEICEAAIGTAPEQ